METDALSPQEKEINEILEKYYRKEKSTIYEPVFLKIPIKNCQDKLSSKNILESLYQDKKQTEKK